MVGFLSTLGFGPSTAQEDIDNGEAAELVSFLFESVYSFSILLVYEFTN